MNSTTIDMKCSFLEYPKKPQASSFSILTRMFEQPKVKKSKNSPAREDILGKTSSSSVTESGHSGCRDESHPACCFLTSYLGSMLARRKSWQPRPTGDNIAFLPECFPTFQLDSTLCLLCGIT